MKFQHIQIHIKCMCNFKLLFILDPWCYLSGDKVINLRNIYIFISLISMFSSSGMVKEL